MKILMTRTLRHCAHLGILALTLGLALVPLVGRARAQATGDRVATDTGTTTNRAARDDGFNYGWLGLVGLAGLAGLLPRNDRTAAVRRPTDTPTR